MVPRQARPSALKRQESVERLATSLKRRFWPRMTMLLAVSSAAGVGFLSSVVMLWMGLRYMPIRYALAGCAGYAVFLTFMNWWLGRHAGESTLNRLVDVDNTLDVSGAVFRKGSNVAGRAVDGLFRGGRSGGAGASASFDSGVVAPSMNPAPLMMNTGTGTGGSKGFSLDLDDNAVMPLLAVVAIAAGLAACATVIWQAPQMLAELIVDGTVAGAAYRGLRTSAGNWTAGVIQRTWLPATALIGVFVLLGVAGHYFKPAADSIGDFFR